MKIKIQKRKFKAHLILGSSSWEVKTLDDGEIVGEEDLPKDILEIEDFSEKIKKAANHINTLNNKVLAINRRQSNKGKEFDITLNYLI